MSTTSYIPFDSAAPSAFHDNQRNLSLIASFITLLLYDQVITLDKEVEWIWTLRWGLPKVLFIFNRYVLNSLILVDCISRFVFPLPIPFCHVDHFLSWVPLLNFGTIELLLVTRVCSLYGHRKLVTWSLGGLFVLALIGSIVSEVQYTAFGDYNVILYYKYLPGCWGITSGNVVSQWHMWVCFVVVEGVLMLLTAYKVLSYHTELNKTITVLARDSIFYFILIFACLVLILADQVDHKNIEALRPGQCITSIAIGRLMMNIRGLILDDPEHTVHLQTLQFSERTIVGLEMDEAAPGQIPMGILPGK